MSFDSDYAAIETKPLDKATIIKNKIRQKVLEKKTTKIMHLTQKNRTKFYKKYLLLKRFEEDDIN